MDQGKVLLFDPVTLTTLCDTAKCVLFYVIALTAKDKVPYIIVRTMSPIRTLEYWVGTVGLTFHLQGPLD